MPDYNTPLTSPLSTSMSGAYIPSAARTVLVPDTICDENVADAKGIIVFLVVTAASGTGGLSLQVKAQGGGGVGVLLHGAPAAVIATSTTTLLIYPGASGAGATLISNAPLPPRFSIGVAVGDASSYTYSVTAYLLS